MHRTATRQHVVHLLAGRPCHRREESHPWGQDGHSECPTHSHVLPIDGDPVSVL